MPTIEKATRTKRARSPSTSSSRISSPDSSHANKSIKTGYEDWPAPRDAMKEASEFILECVRTKQHVLLVPDKDIDGLSSTFILYKTLLLLSHPPSLISLHFLPRSTNIHSPSTSNLPSRCPPLGPATRIIILDQGSRSSPPIVPNDPEEVNILIIDHHYSLIFPPNATILSACQSEPIATTSLLAYTLCSLPVLGSSRIRSSCASLALLGLYGDLGGYSKYAKEVDPWPQDLIEVEKSVGKTNLAKAAAMCNAPRRTAEFNVEAAWRALIEADKKGGGEVDLKTVLGNDELLECKERTSAELKRWQGAPPKFSKDGRVAVIEIQSGYQVHPLIATRWASTLKKSKKTIMVMCANTTYTPSLTHFSCRSINHSTPSAPSEEPKLIDLLKSFMPFCETLSPGWTSRVGDNYGNGHQQASGGVIGSKEFGVLMQALEVGVKEEKVVKKANGGNTLLNYFGKKEDAGEGSAEAAGITVKGQEAKEKK